MVALLILALSMPAAVQAQTAAPALAPSSDGALLIYYYLFLFILPRFPTNFLLPHSKPSILILIKCFKQSVFQAIE